MPGGNPDVSSTRSAVPEGKDLKCHMHFLKTLVVVLIGAEV